MVVTFCGHREVQEPEKVQKWLYEAVAGLIREGADCFYLGGYGQFDTMAADVIRELTSRYHPDGIAPNSAESTRQKRFWGCP